MLYEVITNSQSGLQDRGRSRNGDLELFRRRGAGLGDCRSGVEGRRNAHGEAGIAATVGGRPAGRVAQADIGVDVDVSEVVDVGRDPQGT